MTTRYCPRCEDYRQVVAHTRGETYTMRGRSITVTVSVEVCSVCGESIMGIETEQKLLTQIRNVFAATIESQNQASGEAKEKA